MSAKPEMVRYVPYRPEPTLGGDLLFFIATAALLVVMGFAGCSVPGEDSEGQACSRAVPCPQGLECRAGRCQKPQGCWDATCSPEWRDSPGARAHCPKEELGIDPPPPPPPPPAPRGVRSTMLGSPDWGADPPRQVTPMFYLIERMAQ